MKKIDGSNTDRLNEIVQGKANLIKTHDHTKYPLEDFTNNIDDLRLSSVSTDKCRQYNNDLKKELFIFQLIIQKINEDIRNLNHQMELFKKYRDGLLNGDEEKGFASSVINEYFFVLDIKLFFIWLVVIMDKLAKLLSTLYNSHEIKNKSFNTFSKNINKIKKENMNDFELLINSYQSWFDEIRDIRDNYTIHHSRGMNLVVRSNTGYIATTLGKIIDNKAEYTSISNDKLDNHIIMLYSMLRSLDSYLCDNLNKIPFENKIKKDNKKGITLKINYALLKKMNAQIQSDEKYESQSAFIEFLLYEYFNKNS